MASIKHSLLSNVSCYKPSRHTVPVVQITSSPPPKSVIPSLFVVCEQKHIWNYEYNPIVNPINPLIRMSNVKDVEDLDVKFHKDVYLNLPFEVGEHYDYFQSLFLLGYPYGAALSLRSLIEIFIRDNYGNFLFQVDPSKTKLHIRGDKNALETISDNFRSPRLSVILSALSGGTYDHRYRHVGNKAKARYQSTSSDPIWVKPASFGVLKDTYQKISSTVHVSPSGVNLADLLTEMENVLTVIKEFFINRNSWRVDYA